MAENLYGDLLNPTPEGHGCDIAAQHVDELDKACLVFARNLVDTGRAFRTLDIGGASGAQAKKLAALGADIILIDLTDHTHNIERTNQELGRQAITFIHGDVRTVFPRPWTGPLVDIVHSQRMIGYLPYTDALNLLSSVREVCTPDAQLFLSAGGLDTEFGEGYKGKDMPVEERFYRMVPAIAEKHFMLAPLCLYRMDEFTNLLNLAGFEPIKTWHSPFGDLKTISRIKPCIK